MAPVVALVTDGDRIERQAFLERIRELRAVARAVLEPWIAAETAPGRHARDRALDDVSRAMVRLAETLERPIPR
jgi:hypothetical protein